MINDGTGQVFISPDKFQGEVNNLMVLKKRRITVNSCSPSTECALHLAL